MPGHFHMDPSCFSFPGINFLTSSFQSVFPILF
jgi:hypothetical protein